MSSQSSMTITRRFEFDAAHRVLGHGGKCQYLHGHRYVAEVTLTAPRLNDLGMILDFSSIKEIIGGWIERNWDHNILLHKDDPLVSDRLNAAINDYFRDVPDIWNGRQPYLFPFNPTAEFLASYLFTTCEVLLISLSCGVTHVRLYETPNCWADYSPAIT